MGGGGDVGSDGESLVLSSQALTLGPPNPIISTFQTFDRSAGLDMTSNRECRKAKQI